jgi:hypothetical protein
MSMTRNPELPARPFRTGSGGRRQTRTGAKGPDDSAAWDDGPA